jgi:hypothetical protein
MCRVDTIKFVLWPYYSKKGGGVDSLTELDNQIHNLSFGQGTNECQYDQHYYFPFVTVEFSFSYFIELSNLYPWNKKKMTR